MPKPKWIEQAEKDDARLTPQERLKRLGYGAQFGGERYREIHRKERESGSSGVTPKVK